MTFASHLKWLLWPRSFRSKDEEIWQPTRFATSQTSNSIQLLLLFKSPSTTLLLLEPASSFLFSLRAFLPQPLSPPILLYYSSYNSAHPFGPIRSDYNMNSSRVEDGEQRVAADQWDIDGWHILASEAEKSSFDSAQLIYERLVKQFPPIGKFWRSYTEHMSREQPENYEAVIAIYDRAVKNAPTSIELWRSYLAYVTKWATELPCSKLETDAVAVYERATKATGLDLNANPLWTLYIEFLKKQTMLSDSQRRDTLRNVYQRAVMIFICFFSYSLIFPSCLLLTHAPISYCPSLCLLSISQKRTFRSHPHTVTSTSCHSCCIISLMSSHFYLVGIDDDASSLIAQ